MVGKVETESAYERNNVQGRGVDAELMNDINHKVNPKFHIRYVRG